MLSPQMFSCHACGNEIELVDKVKRSDTCEHCGVDVHCCKNCKFYDTYAHNQCRESATMWEPDKEKANFCTYFTPREGAAEKQDRGSALSALEALFKK
jgi:hypothetical protein